MKTRHFCLLVTLAVGCARSATPEISDLSHRGLPDFAGGGGDDLSTSDDLSGGNDGATNDLPGAGDLRGVDLAGHDLAGADLASRDLATADLTTSPDLSSTDLAGVDLTTPPDLTPPPDLTTSPDLTPPPDLSMPCTVFPQSGCGSGEKCTLGASNTPICASNGNKTTGQQCGTAGSDDCVAGDLCTADAPAPAPASCRAFCSTDSNCTQPAVGATTPAGNKAHCAISITGTSDTVCTEPCNPVLAAGASGCLSGQGCIYGGTASIPELTDCETPGPAANTEGATCTTTADCAAGFACVTSSFGGAVCAQICRNGDDTDCPNPFDACAAPAGVTNPMFGFCCDSLFGC